MDSRELLFEHHGRAVRCDLVAPSGEGGPLAILCHGFGGHRSDFDELARLLAGNGVGALSVGFCGGGTRDDSGFPTTLMSLDTEAEDLNAVLDGVLSGRVPGADPENVFLFGGSQGGMVSALVAAARPEDVAGLMLLFPAFCIPDDWNARFPDAAAVPERLELWGMALGRAYFEAARRIDVWKRIRAYDGPVAIWHGDADAVVNVDYARRAARVYPDAALEIFPGEAHGFSPAGDAKVRQAALAFVKAHVRAARPRLALTLDIAVNGVYEVTSGDRVARMILFGGHGAGEGFEGDILPGGVDIQRQEADGGTLSARYMLEGVDRDGARCRLFIQNECALGAPITRPTLLTDSPALKRLETVPLYGRIDDSDGKLVIRIYERRA